MKLSAHHKADGCEVELTAPLFAGQYDQVYASKVFDFTPMPVLPDSVIVGGSGICLEGGLEDQAEHVYPDYSLYGIDYAMGYTTRGCNRRCPFCIVPRKEGRFRVVGDISNFWDGQDRLVLLDNSLNTDEEHFIFICNQLEKEGIDTEFSQGLDIRYLTDVQAGHLRKVKTTKRIHFAWDFMGYEDQVRRGIEILRKHKLLYRSMFFVLIGFNTTPEEDLYRVEALRGLGADPFIMPFAKDKPYQKDFARWVNHKAIFKSVPWQEYRSAG